MFSMEIQEWKRLESISVMWNLGQSRSLGRTNRLVAREVKISYGIIAKERRFMELKNVLCFEINETIDPKNHTWASRSQKLEKVQPHMCKFIAFVHVLATIFSPPSRGGERF